MEQVLSVVVSFLVRNQIPAAKILLLKCQYLPPSVALPASAIRLQTISLNTWGQKTILLQVCTAFKGKGQANCQTSRRRCKMAYGKNEGYIPTPIQNQGILLSSCQTAPSGCPCIFLRLHQW